MEKFVVLIKRLSADYEGTVGISNNNNDLVYEVVFTIRTTNSSLVFYCGKNLYNNKNQLDKDRNLHLSIYFHGNIWYTQRNIIAFCNRLSFKTVGRFASKIILWGPG